MSAPHHPLLRRTLQLPNRLETAIAGLEEAHFDLTSGTGWSIREYVHHTVEGELMWQMCLRVILGTSGVEFPIHWYFSKPQENWGKSWGTGKRAVGPSLSLFHGSTACLVELLRHIPAECWENFGRVTWPGDEQETRLSVCDVLLMQLNHVSQHTRDIRAIRVMHHL